MVISLTGVYDGYDPESLKTYPGVLLVYWYHFFMVPSAAMLVIVSRITHDENLRNYIKRNIGSIFSVEQQLATNEVIVLSGEHIPRSDLNIYI